MSNSSGQSGETEPLLPVTRPDYRYFTVREDRHGFAHVDAARFPLTWRNLSSWFTHPSTTSSERAWLWLGLLAACFDNAPENELHRGNLVFQSCTDGGGLVFLAGLCSLGTAFWLGFVALLFAEMAQAAINMEAVLAWCAKEAAVVVVILFWGVAACLFLVTITLAMGSFWMFLYPIFEFVFVSFYGLLQLVLPRRARQIFYGTCAVHVLLLVYEYALPAYPVPPGVLPYAHLLPTILVVLDMWIMSVLSRVATDRMVLEEVE